MQYSVIIPVYNEAQTLPELCTRTSQVFDKLSITEYEIIVVDDGSSDQSAFVLEKLSEANPNIQAIILRKNSGKSFALTAGFQHAQGECVITLDGDLQDLPEDIPRLVSKIQEGYDVVTGWRKDRNDTKIRKKGSKFFNWVVGKMTGLHLHDMNCGFKAFRRDVIPHLKLYGDFHRYVPVLAHMHGFRVGEAAVRNAPRKHGESKYPTFRYKGAFDLLTILFLNRFSMNPLHFFAKTALYLIVPSLIILTYLLGSHFLHAFGLGVGHSLEMRPLLTLSLTAFILGINIFLTGFVCDFILHHTASRRLSEMLDGNIKNMIKNDFTPPPSKSPKRETENKWTNRFIRP